MSGKWNWRIGTKEAWARSLGALIGLVMAFTAAVFSTVERMSGNVVATAVLASLSLVLAGVVGLTTIPYLARRVALRPIREAFDYQLTREGIVYFTLTLVVGIAALNTGNNLLFIVVSAMLAAVLMSGVVSGVMLRALELEVAVPSHVFAKSMAVVRIRLTNRRRWIPCFSVSVVQSAEPVLHLHRFLRRKRATRRSQLPPHQPVLTTPVFFPYVPSRSSVAAHVELRFERRGLYRQEVFGLSTRFPFSLFIKTRKVELARELIVYPCVEPTEETLQALPLIRGEFESMVRGRGADLYRIRDYVAEDSARHLDWKATAKTGDLKVREFTREDERKLRIVFDNPGPGVLDEPAYERMVTTAASLAWHLADEDTQLSFVAPGFEGSDLNGFFAYLALVQPAPGMAVTDRLELSDDYNLIVTARPLGTVATPLWANSYFIVAR